MNTTQPTTQERRDEKARQIHICRHYLAVAKQLGLSDTSTTVRYWKGRLAECREIPV